MLNVTNIDLCECEEPMRSAENGIKYCAACGNPFVINEVDHRKHGQGQLVTTIASSVAVVYFYEQQRSRNVFVKDLEFMNVIAPTE